MSATRTKTGRTVHNYQTGEAIREMTTDEAARYSAAVAALPASEQHTGAVDGRAVAADLAGIAVFAEREEEEPRDGMLTQEQRDEFAVALLANDGNLTTEEALDEFRDGNGIEDADIAETRETVADFAAQWGRETIVAASVRGRLHAWSGVQIGKGKRRGDLYVMDFGSARAVHFTGGK